MSRQTTAEFLADCLSHMPDQPEQLQRAVDTVIAGLTRIANGGEWSEEKARAASNAAVRAAALAAWEAADWAAWDAADGAAYAAAWAAYSAADGAAYAADWAAVSHPNPDAERERQAKVRKKLGLNTKGA